MAQLSEIDGSIIGQSSFQEIPAVFKDTIGTRDTIQYFQHDDNNTLVVAA